MNKIDGILFFEGQPNPSCGEEEHFNTVWRTEQ